MDEFALTLNLGMGGAVGVPLNCGLCHSSAVVYTIVIIFVESDVGSSPIYI